jgi:excinuclease ABC subunit C
VHQPAEQRRAWLEMAQTNADLQLARLLAEEGSQQARTRALVEALDLARRFANLRIECFDISHTAGESTQASCVVFEAHKMQNAQYRRYNITDITPGDDYAAMRQVLLNALQQAGRSAANLAVRPVLRGQKILPDLVLVDGGKGQVAMAREVFESLGLDLSLHRRGGKRRRPQGGLGRAGVCRWARQGVPGQRLGRADAGGANP